jgi:hypothetical protein
VPAIHFGTGNPALYGAMRDAGGDVIGVDWRVDLGAQWDALGAVSIMGNLDPAALLAPRDVMFARADEVLAQAGGRPGHVFNLGHGIMPEAQVDQVRALVDHVHERSSRGMGGSDVQKGFERSEPEPERSEGSRGPGVLPSQSRATGSERAERARGGPRRGWGRGDSGGCGVGGWM